MSDDVDLALARIEGLLAWLVEEMQAGRLHIETGSGMSILVRQLQDGVRELHEYSTAAHAVCLQIRMAAELCPPRPRRS